MNTADSFLVSRLLEDAGINKVSSLTQADAVVLLTCSVRQHAEDRAAGFAKTMRGEGKKVIIAGCMGQLRRNELISEGIADYVLGPDQYRDIPKLLVDSDLQSNCSRPELTMDTDVLTYQSNHELETYSDLIPQAPSSVSAQVAVMRGCNNYCAYCVVPYARGRERCVPYSSIKKQVEYLVANGVKEIFLLGQNVLAYRLDGLDFVDILERLTDVAGLERLGFLTSHPRDLTYAMVERMKRIPQLLHFFHLPLQSASDRILFAMGRGYSIADYEKKVCYIRNAFPDVYLTTDLLVGFPGETLEDYHKTIKVVERIGFDFAYMFAYSERPGTRAAKMNNKVPIDERKKRLAQLIELQGSITTKRMKRYVGRQEEVFVTAPAPRGGTEMLALTKSHRPVILKQSAELGKSLTARLTGLSGRTLIAEAVAKEVA